VRLRATQRWFLDEISSAPGAARRVPAGHVVLPSATLTAAERVDIYRHMVAGRLLESLEADFPGVRTLVGEETFVRVAHRYVRAHPPSSWTLNHLGADFPLFLRRVRGLPRAALVRDVAAIERAMSEAFDAEDAPALTREAVAAMDAAVWPAARLEPAASLRVLALRTGANPVVTALRRGRPLPRRISAAQSWVAVYRKDLRVWRLDLTRTTHAALAALVRGRSLGAAVAAASRAHDGDPAALPALVRNAFATWIGDGLFAAVRRPAASG
jgi:hypothetical protein